MIITNEGKVKDESDKRYGRLVVRCRADSKDGARWLCDCDCGGEREVKGSDLRRGKVTDCLECTDRRKRKLGVLQALYLVGPPPCERNCTLMKHCTTQELACKIFWQWVNQNGPLRDADPDPARYMPSREIYREIFPNDK